jgi:undecaprenyl-diphosphatase
MPVLIAVAIATVVVTLVLTLVARLGRRTGPVGVVQASADDLVEEALRHPALRRFLLARRDGTKATGWLLTIALGTLASLTLVVGLVLEMVQTHQGFARWDDSAARWGAAHTTGTAESIVRVITQLGSTPVIIVVCVVAAVVEYRRVRTRAVPAFLLTVVTSELIINNVIKVAVGRQRPNVARLVQASGFSFPSGHAASSAAVYAAIALLAGRRRSRRAKAVLAGVAGGITVAVATSRVLLGAHWLTDVIAGAALGWACFALSSIAYGGRLMHFGAPVAQATAVLAAESDPSNTPAARTAESRP